MKEIYKTERTDRRFKEKDNEYKFIKEYPHFNLYQEVKSGYYECFF